MKEIFDEVKLVNNLKKGDVHAFEALYYYYFKAIRQNIFKLIKDDTSADDLLQDVFTTLWEKRATIKSENGVAAWLYVVSFNKSIKYLQKRLREEATKDVFDGINAAQGSLINEAEFELQLAIVEEAIEQLSERRKIAFCRYRLQGYSLDEVAEEMGIGKETVKSYLKDGQNAIRNYIKQHHRYPTSLGCLLCFYLSSF